MPTFRERARSPLLLGRGFGGPRNLGQPGLMNPTAMGAGNTGAPIGSDGMPMDVVYDQRPEIAQKGFDLEKRKLAMQENQQRIANEQGQREELRDIDNYERQRRLNVMTDREKAELIYNQEDLRQRNRMELEAAKAAEYFRRVQEQQRGATDRTNTVVGGRANVAGVNNSAAMDRTQALIGGRQSLQDDAQAYDATQGQPMSDIVNARIADLLRKDTRFASIVKWDPQAKQYMVTPPKQGGFMGFGATDDIGADNLRKEFNMAIYGPQRVDPSQQRDYNPEGQATIANPNPTASDADSKATEWLKSNGLKASPANIAKAKKDLGLQ